MRTTDTLINVAHLPDAPIWPAIVPYLRVELPKRPAPHRIEVALPEDRSSNAYRQLTTLIVGCARCHRPIHPVRQRKGWQTSCLSVSCDLDTNISCSRSAQATRAVNRLIKAIQQWHKAQNPTLL